MEHVVSAAGIARIYYYLRAVAATTADSGARSAMRQRLESGLASGQGSAAIADANVADAAATADAATTADAGAAAAAVDAEVRAAIDPSAVVAAHGTPGETGADPHCVAAMEAFLDALGAEAANLALRFQAQGGVFLAGV